MTVVFGIGVLTILLVVVVGIVYLWVLAVKSIVEAINKDGLLKDAERERDELRQQLEDAKSKCRLDQSENSGIGHCTGCGHVIDPVADVIADAMGRQSKEKFEKAWKAGKPHGCTIHEGDIASVVKCSDCDYSLEASNFLAQALKAAHEAGRTADTRGMTANYMARSFLMNKSMLKTDGTHEFVKLTEDNAGLILAAFPEQVTGVLAPENVDERVWYLDGPNQPAWMNRTHGTWLRVESDHLTPATDEETERLNDDNV